MAVRTNGNEPASEFAALNSTQTQASAQPNPADINQQPPVPPYGAAAPNVQANVQSTYEQTKANAYAAQGVQVGRGLLSSGLEFDVPYSPSSAKIQAFLTEFDKVAKEQVGLVRNKSDWEFLTFDGPTHQVMVSAVLFVRRGGKYASVFAYLVQDQNEVLQDRTFPGMVNGVQVNLSVPQLTEELVSTESPVMARIVDYVRNSYASHKLEDVFFAGALVLPPELEPTNTQQLGRALFYGNAASESLLFQVAGIPQRFSMKQKAQNETLGLKLDFHAGNIANSVGIPVRSDVSIKLLVNADKNKQQGLGISRSQMFSVTNGYMNIMYTGQGQTMFNPVMGQMYSPIFRAGFVITALDNQFGKASLETQLLSLASAAVLTNQYGWYQAFQPNYHITEPGEDPKDVGLITMDANYQGEPLAYTNTKENGFNLYQFMQKYFHQDLMYFIDVPELGDLSYLQRAFLEAAGTAKDPELAARANAAIIDAANFLTDGAFGEIYQSNDPVVYNEVDRVEIGFYLTDKGEMAPLANIDFLYALSRMGLDKARELLDTYNPGTADSITRFAIRKQIYDTFFAGYQIRGFARRLTINPRFMMALGQALQRVGGTMAIETHYHQGQTVDRTYHNQVLGVAPNAVGGFVQGGMFGNQLGNNGPWRYYQTPMYTNQYGNYTYNGLMY